MAEPVHGGDLEQAAFSPEITLEMYTQLPEEVCAQIEVVDGWMVRCGSPSFSHQTIAHNFVSLLRDAVKGHDRTNQACHRVAADLDVLLSQAPKFHFRRPDVVVFRCVDYDRGGWERKPYAADCVLVIEIVSGEFRLALDGSYISERLNVRRRDFHAVDSFEPFRVQTTWEQLDDGL
jgi:Uma2 family endonuclease